MKVRLTPGIFWWLHPAPTFLLALLPFLISGHLMSGPEYSELWHTEKHLDLRSGILCACIVAAFVAGSISYTIFRRNKPKGETPVSYARLQLLFLFSFIVTTLGYIFWGAVCYAHGVGPAQVIAVLRGDTGAVYTIRDLGTTIPGLTTATQFGMAAAIFGAMLWNHRRSFTVGAILGLLVVMSMVRALLWSERLATIEILVPMVVALFTRRDWYSHPRFRRLLAIAPLAGAAGLYLFFTVSESVRSWGHYAAGGDSLWYFSWMRLCGYYITALNNGALMHKAVGTVPFPYTVFECFWKFPGISTLLPYNDIFSVDPYAYMDSLKEMGNPEFNNPSGIFPYVVDFGGIGACVFWAMAGWVCTAAWRGFKQGAMAGVLCYPLLYVSLLEISRIPYLTSARTLPSWVMLFAGCFLLKRVARRPRLVELRSNRRPRTRLAAPANRKEAAT